jgi:DNA repair photolyase
MGASAELAPNIRRVWNPPNPYQTQQLEWIDAAPAVELQVFEEVAKSVISHSNNPDMMEMWSVNPYRGCFHGCAYCYARPTHQYLELGAGTDFERRIVVKTNAAKILRREISVKSWKRNTLFFSGVTDCYQPLEASYEITRQCLEVCRDRANPVVIITKGALVRRDIDLFCQIHERASISIMFSIPFSDDTMSKKIEFSAPRPSTRLRAMREIADAGIPVGVMVAPIIPGMNDSQIPDVLKLARAAGATRAGMILLRLPAEVKAVFLTRLKEHYPDRYDKVVHQIRLMRGGKLYNSEWGKRHSGDGPRWDAIRFLFKQTCKELGLNDALREYKPRIPLGAQYGLELPEHKERPRT